MLDEVRLIPVRPAAPACGSTGLSFHRFALVALAIQDDEGLRASDMELTRTGPSYTVDTLRALAAEGWEASQLSSFSAAMRLRKLPPGGSFPPCSTRRSSW